MAQYANPALGYDLSGNAELKGIYVMLPIVTLILFAVGAGIFIALSAMEQRVYPLFWNGAVAEQDIRAVQTTLALIVNVLPKMMMIIVFGSGILIALQALGGRLDEWLWPIVTAYTVLTGLILVTLFPTIKGVKNTDPLNGPIEEVRPVTRATIIVHHLGLLLAILMIVMFAALVSGW